MVFAGFPFLAMSLLGAGTVAVGYSHYKKKKERERRSNRFYNYSENRVWRGHRGGRGRGHFYPLDEIEDDYDHYYGYEDEEEEFYDPRPPPRSRRNPNDVSIFDTDIQTYGNYATRWAMARYAKHKMNNLYGYQASIWDLEPFLK